MSSNLQDNSMDAEFFTTHGKLTLNKNTIWEKTIIQQPPSYWYHSFVLLVAFLIYTISEALSGKLHEWAIALVILVWLYPHLTRIYQLLFVNVWRWYIPLSEIKDVYHEREYNELEEKVRIKLQSGREKTYIFRKSEQQAEKFVEQIRSRSEITTQQFNKAPGT